MNIQYCDSCGLRVSESDFQNGALQIENKAYCQKCAVAVPRPTKPPSGPAATRPSDKITSNTRLQAVSRAAARPAPVPARHAPPAASAKAEQNLLGPVLIVGAIGVLLGVFLFGGSSRRTEGSADSNKKPPAAAPARDTAPAQKTPAPAAAPVAVTAGPAKAAVPTPSTAAPAPAAAVPAVSSNVDPREDYARRKWAEFKASEKKLVPYYARKEVEAFVASYGSTAVGKEAAVYLQTMPKGEPPAANAAAGEHQVLWSDNFESGGNGITKGSRTTENAYGGAGYCLKSEKQDSTFFTSVISLNPRKNGTDAVNIGENTWIRFACRIDGGSMICFHSAIGTGLFEKYVGNLTPGKWQWVTFKMSEYTANIRDKNQPRPLPNTPFTGTAIFGCQHNGATTVYIDDITFGDGPIPPEPK
ncbi:MAG TPA: hypothetical protein VEK08_02915 [Planctomycetota bacterium]|nr:hypothetical protein [Planctomycetota bacterium]